MASFIMWEEIFLHFFRKLLIIQLDGYSLSRYLAVAVTTRGEILYR